jgi:glutathione S-transferase
MLKLYYSAGSCALASHIALEEAGSGYEAVRISLADGDQRRPDFLRLNPNGRVPALVTDAGVLTETVAILGFIAQSFPQAGLAPTDAFGFARAQAFNAYLATTVHVAYAHRRRAYRWADDETARAHLAAMAPEKFVGTLQLVEENLLEGPWVLGQTYSVCDGYLFTLADWLEGVSIDPSRLPRIRDHRERVRARPAVRKVLAQQAS